MGGEFRHLFRHPGTGYTCLLSRGWSDGTPTVSTLLAPTPRTCPPLPCPVPFTGRLQGPCCGEASHRHDEGQGRASGLHSVHRGRQVGGGGEQDLVIPFQTLTSSCASGTTGGGGGEQDLVIPHLVIPFHTLTSSYASGTTTGVTRTCLSQSRRLARRRAWWPRSLSARWVDGSGWWLVVGGYVHGGRDI